jgi:hypothetical protein
MTFAQFQERLALRLGNLQSSDPFFKYIDPAASGGSVDANWINTALNAVLMRTLAKNRRSLNCFPEMREKWTAITTVNDLRITIPSDLLVAERVYSFDSSDAPDMDDDTVKPMVEVPIHKLDILSRSTSISGYPRLWTRDGDFINFYPTPRTGYTTYLLVRGLRKEPQLVDDADEPLMNTLWHDAVLHYASYLGALELNRVDEAKKWLEACDLHIMQTIDILGLESSSGENVVKIEGDPTR